MVCVTEGFRSRYVEGHTLTPGREVNGEADEIGEWTFRRVDKSGCRSCWTFARNMRTGWD